MPGTRSIGRTVREGTLVPRRPLFDDPTGLLAGVLSARSGIRTSETGNATYRKPSADSNWRWKPAKRVVLDWRLRDGRDRINDTLERLLGFEPGEFGGRAAVFDLITPRTALSPRTNRASRDRHRLRRGVPDDRRGRRRTVGLGSGQPIEDDDSTLMVGVHHDITEHKERERDLGYRAPARGYSETTTTPISIRASRQYLLNRRNRELTGLVDEESSAVRDFELFPEETLIDVGNDSCCPAAGHPIETGEQLIIDCERPVPLERRSINPTRVSGQTRIPRSPVRRRKQHYRLPVLELGQRSATGCGVRKRREPRSSEPDERRRWLHGTRS
ncbi:hypothetical protein C8039_10795 [Halogeometricum sp. wsp3]|nr:hypothetical protein C8039_10795 [Halogeometricum sp. wsp3]